MSLWVITLIGLVLFFNILAGYLSIAFIRWNNKKEHALSEQDSAKIADVCWRTYKDRISITGYQKANSDFGYLVCLYIFEVADLYGEMQHLVRKNMFASLPFNLIFVFFGYFFLIFAFLGLVKDVQLSYND